MEDQLYPIAILIDELKNDDVQLRLNSIRRLSTIAVALDTERTRNELVPFLSDSVDDDDDVLLALAEELGKFVPYVGGPQYAHCLFEPLAPLCNVEEPAVREKAVDSIQKIASQMPTSAVVAHLLPLLRRLATGEWYASRAASCGLFPSLERHLAQGHSAERQTLFDTYAGLCADATPMVRRAACSHLADYAKAVRGDRTILVLKFVPMFLKLARDEQDSVRLLSVDAGCCLALELLTGNSTATSNTSSAASPATAAPLSSETTGGLDQVASVLRATASDPAWRVRYVVADKFVELCGVQLAIRHPASAASIAAIVIPLLASKANLPGSMAFSSAGTFNNQLLSAAAGVPSSSVAGASASANSVRMEDIGAAGAAGSSSADAAANVLGISPAIASSNAAAMQLIKGTLTSEITNAEVDSMLGLFARLLQDSEAEVRTAAANRVTDVCKAIASHRPQDVVALILPVLHEMCGDANQHVRASLAGTITGLAVILGKQATLDHLIPKLIALLHDEFHEVRLHLISQLAPVHSAIGLELLSQSLLPAILELARDKQWRVRLAMMEYVPLLSKQLGGAFMDDQLLTLCSSWLSDAVYSVRESAVSTCTELARMFGNDWTHRRLIPKVVELSQRPNYLLRVTVLQVLAALIPVVGCSPDVLNLLVDSLARDSVPNVRLNVAKTLSQIARYVQPPSLVQQRVKPALERLRQDADGDVHYFAEQAALQIQ